MLATRKNTQEYNALAEMVCTYAKKSGYEDIKADFTGYDSPAALTMVKENIKLTPDFTAKRGNKKFYFELVVKEQSEDDQDLLISKWKALELFANMKGGSLQLFVQNGSLKYANSLIKDNGITAKIIKLNSL